MALRDRAFSSGTIIEEDVLRTALTGKPVIHSAIHPKRQESYFNQVYACRDALFDPHSDALNMTKATIAGAFLGGVLGYSYVFVFKRIPTFAMRKAFKHIRDNTFGTAHIFKQVLMPYALGGAATGFSYWMFWKVIWGAETGRFLNVTLGNGVFAALATSVLYSPKYWWAGLYGGTLAGFIIYSLFYRNLNAHREYGQVQLKLTGLSEEDREKIKFRDYMHELGMNPLIEQGKLIGL